MEVSPAVFLQLKAALQTVVMPQACAREPSFSAIFMLPRFKNIRDKYASKYSCLSGKGWWTTRDLGFFPFSYHGFVMTWNTYMSKNKKKSVACILPNIVWIRGLLSLSSLLLVFRSVSGQLSLFFFSYKDQAKLKKQIKINGWSLRKRRE